MTSIALSVEVVVYYNLGIKVAVDSVRWDTANVRTDVSQFSHLSLRIDFLIYISEDWKLFSSEISYINQRFVATDEGCSPTCLPWSPVARKGSLEYSVKHMQLALTEKENAAGYLLLGTITWQPDQQFL